ncbi:hypothetical protein DFJ69_5908 [Thermomonospora umbrina]|uniref:Uncharacterized protein n=1 Tax=Thermomonospora umbrina TaxID=111806 RepID=A0A3D9T554_9ACTN|nr:hypothetical protein DFJ69_5908 [Thermomonospora umbrina]
MNTTTETQGLPAAASKPEDVQREECTCVFSCAEDRETACSLSGTWHVHPDNGLGIFGPCPAHPDAPGDL